MRALSEFKVHWLLECGPNDECDHQSAVIARRYSHSAVLHDNSMYVFGGCTNSLTTFNDLWRLELGTRRWIRPLANGNYPSPKACSSLICYEDTLVLFGGWAYPCSYPFHQAYQLFNELHLYYIQENRWQSVSTLGPPPTAGHSVSVHGQSMIMFGGMQRPDQNGPLVKSNDVWMLDLKTLQWQKMETPGPKPRERYGHSQIALDNHHALIMGGCGGPNGLYTDVWLLEMGFIWQWREILVQGTKYAPPDTWCHPTCRVGEYIVVLNPRNKQDKGPRSWNPTERRLNLDVRPRIQPQIEENVNGRRGTLREPVRRPFPQIRAPEQPVISLEAFRTAPDNVRPNVEAVARRQMQLEILRRVQAQLRVNNRAELFVMCNGPGSRRQNERKPEKRVASLALYLLDISRAIDGIVRWMEPHEVKTNPSPEETLLYTLIHGNGELVMFGGIQKDQVNLQLGHLHPGTGASTVVSNSLHFLIAPNDII